MSESLGLLVPPAKSSGGINRGSRLFEAEELVDRVADKSRAQSKPTSLTSERSGAIRTDSALTFRWNTPLSWQNSSAFMTLRKMLILSQMELSAICAQESSNRSPSNQS